MENSILATINKEVQDFKTGHVQVVPGLLYSQYDTIQQIYYYYNSKFTTGDTDDDGDKKYFYNITKNPCKVFTKAVDFDTKNIRLLTAGGGDPIKTWFMERDLKFWMRDKQFGKVLNRIFQELPIYGTVVLKIVDGYPYFVDLRNFVVDQSADTLEGSSHVIESHNYSVAQFRKIAKDMKWSDSKVNEVIREYYKMTDTSHIRLYERYGDVEVSEGNWEYRKVYIADVGVDEIDHHGEVVLKHTGVEMESTKVDKHPYWEFHAEKIPGRWHGVGVVESLFEPQIRQNEISNLQAKSSYWAALQVFQTRDGSVNRNLLSDVANGEILNTDSEITKIDISERNLAFFNQEHQKWMSNRDELTFSYDVVQGERLPAGTPLGSAQLAVSQTLTYFETLQENIALEVKEMLYKVIIPSFQKQNSTKHTLRLVGKDLDQYIEMVKNDLVFKEIVRMAVNFGKFVSEQEADAVGMAIAETIKQEKEKIITIPSDFYKNLKYDVDIDITGESIDTRVRSATMFAILQAITTDPTMTTDPMKRKMLYIMGEDGGINMGDLLSVEQKSPEDIAQPGGKSPIAQQGAGGGVSAPTGALQSAQGQATQTI